MTTERRVSDALRTVADPCSIAAGVPIDLIAMGLLAALEVHSGHVTITLRLTGPFCMQIGNIIERVTSAVRAVDGVDTVRVDIDHQAEWLPSMMAPGARSALRQIRPFPIETVPE